MNKLCESRPESLFCSNFRSEVSKNVFGFPFRRPPVLPSQTELLKKLDLARARTMKLDELDEPGSVIK